MGEFVESQVIIGCMDCLEGRSVCRTSGGVWVCGFMEGKGVCGKSGWCLGKWVDFLSVKLFLMVVVLSGYTVRW